MILSMRCRVAHAVYGAAGDLMTVELLVVTAAAVPTRPRVKPAATPTDTRRIFLVRDFIALLHVLDGLDARWCLLL
jgi:hypothetical protein